MSTESSDSSVAAQDEKQPLALEIKVDQPSACERHVTVTIPRADIDRYVGEAVDELRPKAEVPGFRPGRAPRKLVESRFQEQVAEQVKGSLLMDSMTQVSDDCDFSAISEPDFDFDAIELPAEGEMTFEFNIEVRPEFDLPEWENLDIEQPVHEYTDEEVDGRLDEAGVGGWARGDARPGERGL
ncbi:MAG: trigger factor family protein [Pirellulaceae bacterium]|nr:trigger factor family protein [Pirellulaceae bacterium]